MITTRDLVSRAALSPDQRHLERLKDGRTVATLIRVVRNPGIKSHARTFFYIDGKRVTRATVAIVLRGHHTWQ